MREVRCAPTSPSTRKREDRFACSTRVFGKRFLETAQLFEAQITWSLTARQSRSTLGHMTSTDTERSRTRPLFADQRSYGLRVRLRQDERAKLTADAKRAGVKLSHYVRSLLGFAND